MQNKTNMLLNEGTGLGGEWMRWGRIHPDSLSRSNCLLMLVDFPLALCLDFVLCWPKWLVHLRLGLGGGVARMSKVLHFCNPPAYLQAWAWPQSSRLFAPQIPWVPSRNSKLLPCRHHWLPFAHHCSYVASSWIGQNKVQHHTCPPPSLQLRV